MKALYLEPDEEITSVIDRLRAINDDEVAIVVPKRAGILQSIINLKLLRYQSEQLKKRISIVTTDKTGRNLASAVGLTVYQRLPEGEEVSEAAINEPSAAPVPITFKKRSQPKSDKAPKITKRSVEEPTEIKSDPEIIPVRRQPKADIVAPSEPVEAETASSENKSLRDRLPRLSMPTVRKPNLPKPSIPKPKLSKPSLPQAGWPIAVAVLVALLIGGGVAAAVTLPKADITVTPNTQPFSVDIPVTLSARALSVDAGGNVLPAKVIEVSKDGSATLDTTGTKDAGEKASGEITVVNTLPRNQSMVTRTRFAAPDGRIFRAQSAISVPAGGQSKVTVLADDGGEAGNLPAGTKLIIPGLGGTDAVYGQVDTALTGGTSTPSPEVSAGDVEKGKQALAVAVAKDAVPEAKGKLAVGYALSDQASATTILNSTPDPKPGTSAKTFTTAGKVRVRYFTYQDGELQKVIKEDLKAKIPPGSDLVEERISQMFVPTSESADTLVGVMRISTFAVPQISRDGVKAAVVGKSAAEAKTALTAMGVRDVKVTLSPFWVNSVPGKLERIEIHYRTGVSEPVSSATPTASASPVPAL